MAGRPDGDDTEPPTEDDATEPPSDDEAKTLGL